MEQQEQRDGSDDLLGDQYVIDSRLASGKDGFFLLRERGRRGGRQAEGKKATGNKMAQDRASGPTNHGQTKG